jgi:hypothetical protein
VKIYSVYDKKSCSYGPLFEVQHDAIAVREFGNAISQERSPLRQYPDDFELHVVGEKASEFPHPSWQEQGPIVCYVPSMIISARAWLDSQPKPAGLQQLSLLPEA